MYRNSPDDIMVITFISAIIVFIVGFLFWSTGAVAFDNGYYVEVVGMELDNWDNTAVGSVYVVMAKRTFGPDRVAGTFATAQEAFYFMAACVRDKELEEKNK